MTDMTDEQGLAPAQPIKGFIELTDESNEKILLAVHTICLVEQSGYQKPESPAQITLNIIRAHGTVRMITVQETYQQVMQLLARA